MSIHKELAVEDEKITFSAAKLELSKSETRNKFSPKWKFGKHRGMDKQ